MCSLGLSEKLKEKRNTLIKSKSELINIVSIELEEFRSVKGFTTMDRTLTAGITHFEKELLD